MTAELMTAESKRAVGLLPPPFHSKTIRSGGRCDVIAFFFDFGLADPAARLGSFLFAAIVTRSDRRRKDSERNPLFAFPFLAATSTIRTFARLRAVAALSRKAVALLPFGALGPITALLRALPDFGLVLIVAVVRIGSHFLVTVGVVLVIIAARAALGLLLVEARTTVLQNAKIMVGVLEIIFGLDPVAGKLGVARQALVFFEQLGGVAALAIITGVAGVAGHSLRTLSAAATTTAALTIIDQMYVPCRTGAGQAGRQNLPSIGSVVPVRETGPRA
jgi:hypothetical protein